MAGRNGTDTLVSQWLARLDAGGEARWSLGVASRFGLPISALSVASDGRIYVAAFDRLAAFDADGRVLWQRQTPGRPALLCGLPDGSVIINSAQDVLRYSPTEGVLWGWHLGPDIVEGEGNAMVVTEEGRIFFAAGELVAAMDLDGDVLWAARWTGGRAPVGPVPVAAVAPSEAGGFVIAGGHPPTVVRMDAEGRVEWLRIVGTYREGAWEDDCYPRCNTDVAMDLAVNPAGEVMVVGYSTAAAQYVGEMPYTSLFAFWLDPAGTLIRKVAMAERHPTDHSEGLAAAVTETGEWVVGGHFSGERAVLASLDASGTVGGECSYVGEPNFARPTADWTLESIDVTLSPSELEVVEGEPLELMEIDAPMERLCW